MKKYFNYQITKEVIVQNLITIESLEISSDFFYPEEQHDFYEFAYIDSGVITSCIEDSRTQLQQGDFLLIPPMKRHFYSSVVGQSASVFIICFRSSSEFLSIIDKKISLDKEGRRLISNILRESKNAFVFPFVKKIQLLDKPTFGAQQMVEINIEQLLIHLVRAEINENEDIIFVMNSLELENSLSNDIIHLLKNHIYDRLTLDQISQQTYYSKTFINNIFKKNTGTSIMKYYMMLKVQEAKKLLRKNLPVSTIAGKLNFESTTYFTKVFKKYTGMTPSDFKKSIL